MNLRKATEADLKAMGEKTVSRGCLGQIPEQIDYVYALEDEGLLVGVGGIKMMNPTTAWAWLDLTARASEHKVVLFRAIRDCMDALMRERGITRLMAAVEEDFPEAIRLVQHLGFIRESRMERWAGDKAAWMYVRLAGAR